MTQTATITSLKSTIFADGGMDEVLTQKSPILADCWMEGKRVVKVVAPDGIVFAGPSGELRRPDNFDITDLCDLAQLAREIEYDLEFAG